MKFDYKVETNAITLSMRNFGGLAKEIQKKWMMFFYNSSNNTNIKLPTKLILEITNTCNLDCPMCRVGRYGVNLSRVMSLKTLKHVINQIPTLKSIRLNGLGESTVIPNFIEYIDLIESNNINVELITNGTGKINDYKKIIKNNGIIIFSMDAVEEKLFETLRKPARLDDFIAIIEDLSSYSREINKSDCLFLLFTLQSSNISELSKVVKLAKKTGINNIIVNVVKLENNTFLSSKFEQIKIEFKKALKISEQENISLMLPSHIDNKDVEIDKSLKTSSEYCNMPWEETVIRWNGDVQICNMFNPYTTGNIFLNEFKDIWNNAFSNLFREQINTECKHPYCDGCVYIKNAYEYRKI
jgi:radical SAM protein with 4Fe4S-binding SPASM domain